MADARSDKKRIKIAQHARDFKKRFGCDESTPDFDRFLSVATFIPEDARDIRIIYDVVTFYMTEPNFFPKLTAHSHKSVMLDKEQYKIYQKMKSANLKLTREMLNLIMFHKVSVKKSQAFEDVMKTVFNKLSNHDAWKDSKAKHERFSEAAKNIFKQLKESELKDLGNLADEDLFVKIENIARMQETDNNMFHFCLGFQAVRFQKLKNKEMSMLLVPYKVTQIRHALRITKDAPKSATVPTCSIKLTGSVGLLEKRDHGSDKRKEESSKSKKDSSEDEEGGSEDEESGSEDEEGGSEDEEGGSEEGGSEDEEGGSEEGGSEDEEGGSEDEKGGSESEKGASESEAEGDSPPRKKPAKKGSEPGPKRGDPRKKPAKKVSKPDLKRVDPKEKPEKKPDPKEVDPDEEAAKKTDPKGVDPKEKPAKTPDSKRGDSDEETEPVAKPEDEGLFDMAAKTIRRETEAGRMDCDKEEPAAGKKRARGEPKAAAATGGGAGRRGRAKAAPKEISADDIQKSMENVLNEIRNAKQDADKDTIVGLLSRISESIAVAFKEPNKTEKRAFQLKLCALYRRRFKDNRNAVITFESFKKGILVPTKPTSEEQEKMDTMDIDS